MREPVHVSVAGMVLFGLYFLLPLFIYSFGVSFPRVTNVLILHGSLCELFEKKQHLVQNDDKKIPKTSDQEGKVSLQAYKPRQRQAINMW